MRKLTIEATSLTSARAIDAALAGFERELIADADHYWVEVILPSANGGIVAVLSALEEHVRQRADGPAHIRLDGQSYSLEAPPVDNSVSFTEFAATRRKDTDNPPS